MSKRRPRTAANPDAGTNTADGRHRAAHLSELPPTLTVDEAGTMLGISRRSAYRAAARGELPTLRLGRRLLVPTPRLLALLGMPLDGLGGDLQKAEAPTEDAPRLVGAGGAGTPRSARPLPPPSRARVPR